MQERWWNLNMVHHGSHYNSFTSIRSSSMEKLHQGCSMQNLTMSWTPKSKRTFPGFQRFFTHPWMIDGLGVMIFWWRWSCWKLYSGQIVALKENYNWGCLVGILPLSWIPKRWPDSPYFPTVTYSASSDKRFRGYGILTINFAAEFCFWTEQRLNGTELLGHGLTETLEVPNTITVGNSLSFSMVHNMAPYSQWFMSYGCQKLDRSCWFRNLGRLHLSTQVRDLVKFCHKYPRNSEHRICH
jgi:hypothetical protein